MEDHILERTAMPEENVRNAQGETIFEEERPLVCTFLPCNAMLIWYMLLLPSVCLSTCHKLGVLPK